MKLTVVEQPPLDDSEPIADDDAWNNIFPLVRARACFFLGRVPKNANFLEHVRAEVGHVKCTVLRIDVDFPIFGVIRFCTRLQKVDILEVCHHA